MRTLVFRRAYGYAAGRSLSISRALPAIVRAALLLVLLGMYPLRSAEASNGRTGETQLAERLSLAEEAFRRGVSLDQTNPSSARDQYERALLHYEALVREDGIRNGRLYYNIANTYFRLGDLGYAILNYKRAALYIPQDENLEQNLEYARSRRVDRIGLEESERIFKTLFFLHYDVPSRIRLAIFAITFAVIWIMASLMILLDWGFLRTILIVASIASGLFLLSIVVEAVQASRNPEGVITAREVVARKGDAETYQPSFTEPLHAGTEFTALEERPGWIHIELGNGARGWIPQSAAELVIP
jgi:tetratricopeptide (TPR) repeat protein